LASYIKKYAYSNAKTEDLWAVLEEETGEPVKDLMTTWTKQQGYPVIYAKLNGQDLELEQVSGHIFIWILFLSYMENGVQLCMCALFFYFLAINLSNL
jgi:hypothetical protein